MNQVTITFKPKNVTKGLLSALAERARDIMRKRYGLDQNEGMTLEAIGQIYGITRERVRQIEDFSLKVIRKSPAFAETQDIFAELKHALHEYGGVAHERDFLAHLDKNEVVQNHIHFLLVLGTEFTKRKEDDEFHHRWTTDDDHAEKIEQTIRKVASKLSEEDLLPEEEMVKMLVKHLDSGVAGNGVEEKARRWLAISKLLGTNPVGEWGLTTSPNVRVRGIRDYAFLVLREQGSPMHFTEVAKSIHNSFSRRANPATCHNELIKDKRFVLVGRGMYALSDWGYTRGVVREVIETILKEHGPLTEEDVLGRVLKERYVKPNTVLVNLRNPNYFKREKDGRYLVE